MNTPIKVLSKLNRSRIESSHFGVLDEDIPESTPTAEHSNPYLGSNIHKLKHESEARTFKLIDEKDWNISSVEPKSETTFFVDGHSAMSIISVIGPKGSGKSSLLNKIAGKEAFKTYNSSSGSNRISLKHITKGIDIHSTHHRMLLDCQPLLCGSILEDFLTGQSNSQFPKNSQLSDPLTSCHMISLQLATFLIATSDFVIITSKWLIDIHLLKLISTAIMLIGEDNLRAKFIMYSDDCRVQDEKFKVMMDSGLGRNRIDKFFNQEEELLDYISPYSSEKCEMYKKDPSTFTGKNWLSSCHRIWNTTIKNSTMFSDYAFQLHNTNDTNF